VLELHIVPGNVLDELNDALRAGRASSADRGALMRQQP